jgi:hypothetical protein
MLPTLLQYISRKTPTFCRIMASERFRSPDVFCLPQPLGVISQEVVIEACSADGWLLVEAGVWSMPVVQVGYKTPIRPALEK